MAQLTTHRSWYYPDEYEDPYFNTFSTMIRQIDDDVNAIITGTTGYISVDSTGTSLIAVYAGNPVNVISFITATANVGIGPIITPTINDPPGLDLDMKVLRIRTAKTPANATDSGDVGDICWDASYIYVYATTSGWKRAGISTW